MKIRNIDEFNKYCDLKNLNINGLLEEINKYINENGVDSSFYFENKYLNNKDILYFRLEEPAKFELLNDDDDTSRIDFINNIRENEYILQQLSDAVYTFEF